MQKAVIFDMDGVLIDSQPLHFVIDQLALQENGCKVELSDVQKYAGMSNPDRWPKYKEAYQLTKTIDELICMQTKILMDVFHREKLVAIDGILELLTMLKENGIKMAVGSSSSIELIELVLEKIGIRHFFHEIISGEDVSNGKPAPDIFLRAAEKLNVAPSDCIVIEDSANGVNAAFHAKMKCIGFYNPNSGDQDLSRATVVIDDFKRIDMDFLQGKDFIYMDNVNK